MAEAGISDYFYGDEAEQFIYFRIPRLLITDPRFKHLSTDAKLLYLCPKRKRLPLAGPGCGSFKINPTMRFIS